MLLLLLNLLLGRVDAEVAVELLSQVVLMTESGWGGKLAAPRDAKIHVWK